jgi:hypothetical protein
MAISISALMAAAIMKKYQQEIIEAIIEIKQRGENQRKPAMTK